METDDSDLLCNGHVLQKFRTKSFKETVTHIFENWVANNKKQCSLEATVSKVKTTYEKLNKNKSKPGGPDALAANLREGF